MALQHSPSIVTSGLVLCLDAANPRSYPGAGSIWNDASGNGNNGTLINGVVYNSSNLGNLVFDGIDDKVVLTNNFLNLEQSSFTFDFIFKTSQTGTNVIIGKYSGVGADYWVGIQSSKLVWSFGSPTKADIPSLNNVNDNTYKIAQAIYDKQNAKTYLYVNGALQNTGSVPATITSATGDLVLSAFGSVGTFLWAGALASFKIYTRVLSEQEIQQNYNATRGRYGI